MRNNASISNSRNSAPNAPASPQVEATGAQLADLEEAFQSAERAYQHTRGDLDAARTAAVESNKILAQRSARFHAVRQLVESGEGFEKGTQNVLKGLGNPDQFKPTIHGALASFIEADNTCARAIEAALGTHLHAVLVHDQPPRKPSSAASPKNNSASPPSCPSPSSRTPPAPRWKRCRKAPPPGRSTASSRTSRIAGVIERCC
jgi:hypothetical protein